jgi:hypothetical protein
VYGPSASVHSPWANRSSSQPLPRRARVVESLRRAVRARMVGAGGLVDEGRRRTEQIDKIFGKTKAVA